MQSILLAVGAIYALLVANFYNESHGFTKHYDSMYSVWKVLPIVFLTLFTFTSGGGLSKRDRLMCSLALFFGGVGDILIGLSHEGIVPGAVAFGIGHFFYMGKLLDWLRRNNIIPIEQHGFMEGASTTTQLVDCFFDWHMARSNGWSVDIIYFDLSKAFDKVDHQKLLDRLCLLGLRGPLIRWLRSYLNGRWFSVKVGDKLSNPYPCISGVPQGGVLSPLLFLIYTHDLTRVLITHPRIKVQMFADDIIKIYGSFNSDSSEEIREAISKSIMNMMRWSAEWGLPVNLSKTSVLHVGNLGPAKYVVGNYVLKSKTEVRDLGVTFSSELTFDAHIDLIVRKALATMFTILRSLSCNDIAILLKLFKSFVLPVLEYASQVWSPYSRKCKERLERVQKIFTRIAVRRCFPEFLGIELNYSERLKLLNLKSLTQRRIFHDLVFCFRVLKGESKLRPSSYWRFRPTNGRIFSIGIEPFRANKEKDKLLNSLFFRGARWLQKMPADLLDSSNSRIFKTRLKTVDLQHMLNLYDS